MQIQSVQKNLFMAVDAFVLRRLTGIICRKKLFCIIFKSNFCGSSQYKKYVCHWKVSILTLVSKYGPLLISEEQAVVLLWHAEAIACVIETCCENGISNMILTNGAANTVE